MNGETIALIKALQNKSIENLKTSGGLADAGKVLTVGSDGKLLPAELEVGEGQIAVDGTLSVSGAAAGAKETGDAIRSLNGSLSAVSEEVDTLNNGGLELKDEVIQEDVETWLDEHPEATTTVQDGSISKAKLTSELSGEITGLSEYYVPDYATLKTVLTDTTVTGTIFRLGEITIDEPIVLSSNSIIKSKQFRFVGGRIIINATHAFEFPSGSYYSVPAFSDVEFVGNDKILFYHSDGTYPLHGHFTNCLFNRLRLVSNGTCIQEFKFLQCRWISSSTNNTFITCGIMRDCYFQSCVFDNDFKSDLVDANGYYNSSYVESALLGVYFDGIGIEGRSEEYPPFITMGSGQVYFSGLSTENMHSPLVYKKYSYDYGSKNTSKIVIKDGYILIGTNNYLCLYDPESIEDGNRNDFISESTNLSYGKFAGIVSTVDGETVYTEITRNSGLRIFNTLGASIGFSASLDGRPRYAAIEQDTSSLLWRTEIIDGSTYFVGENGALKMSYKSGDITSITISAKKMPCIMGWTGGLSSTGDYKYKPYMLYIASPKVNITAEFTPTVQWIVAPPERKDEYAFNVSYDEDDPYVVNIVLTTTTSNNRALLNNLVPQVSSQYQNVIPSYAICLAGITSAIIKT